MPPQIQESASVMLDTEAPTPGPRCLEDLPNELLSNILSYLDIAPPSRSALLDEPTFTVTTSDHAPLKAANLVSRRWRIAGLPLLFKHARFTGTENSTLVPALSQKLASFLHFLTTNSLCQNVQSLTILVGEVEGEFNKWGPRDGMYDIVAFWQSLFEVINPGDLLIVASAQSLGVLTSCFVNMADAWNFDNSFHYLQLQQPVPKKQTSIPKIENFEIPEATVDDPSRPWEIPRAEFSALFKIRPWTNLLLNEGSFVKAYSAYEPWMRHTPTILSDLLGNDDNPHGAYINPTIRHLSYIAMFPTTSHFCELTEHFPRLDSVYVQIVPRNNILEDPVKMYRVAVDDLWMERNNCYALLVRELFEPPANGNYKHLKSFESGDAADVVAWNMAVDYVKRAGGGWVVERDGVFVREAKSENEAGDGNGEEAKVEDEATNGVESAETGEAASAL